MQTYFTDGSTPNDLSTGDFVDTNKYSREVLPELLERDYDSESSTKAVDNLNIENENRIRTEKLELTRKLATPKGEARFQHFNLMPGQVWVRRGSQEDKLTVEGIWHDLTTMTYLVKFKELNEVFDTHRSNLVSKLSGYDFMSGPDPEIDGTVIDGDLNRTTGSLAFKRSLKSLPENTTTEELPKLEDVSNEEPPKTEHNNHIEISTGRGRINLSPGKIFDDGKKSLTIISVEKVDPLNTKIAFEEIANGKPEVHSDIDWVNMLTKLFGENVFE